MTQTVLTHGAGPAEPAEPGQLAPDTALDHATRARILRLVLQNGPISAVQIAKSLDLVQAGIRRHLGVLEASGLIEQHRIATAGRGRGRPARFFVATPAAHEQVRDRAHALAVEVLAYLAAVAGPEAPKGFAEQRAEQFEQRYSPLIDQAGPEPIARAKALVKAMNDDGYAATLRPVAGGLTLQLCQGHCPVQQVAAAFPELCEAETAAIGRLLKVHVQRLATLAGGDHVCTTCVPVPTASSAQGPSQEGTA